MGRAATRGATVPPVQANMDLPLIDAWAQPGSAVLLERVPEGAPLLEKSKSPLFDQSVQG